MYGMCEALLASADHHNFTSNATACIATCTHTVAILHALGNYAHVRNFRISQLTEALNASACGCYQPFGEICALKAHPSFQHPRNNEHTRLAKEHVVCSTQQQFNIYVGGKPIQTLFAQIACTKCRSFLGTTLKVLSRPSARPTMHCRRCLCNACPVGWQKHTKIIMLQTMVSVVA